MILPESSSLLLSLCLRRFSPPPFSLALRDFSPPSSSSNLDTSTVEAEARLYKSLSSRVARLSFDFLLFFVRSSNSSNVASEGLSLDRVTSAESLTDLPKRPKRPPFLSFFDLLFDVRVSSNAAGADVNDAVSLNSEFLCFDFFFLCFLGSW